jgi:diguanylate cyclase (GGDEF)-like protein
LKASLTAKPNTSASKIYFCCMVSLGLGVLGVSIYQIAGSSVSYYWLVLACLTAVSGQFMVPIPGVRSKISVAESFIFTNVILFGPAVGSVTAALDGFLGFLQSHNKPRRLQYTAFNMASMALSAYFAGTVFFAVLGRGPVYELPVVTLRELILPAGVMALVHYLTNTVGVAFIIALEAQRNVCRVWLERFLWTSVTYFAGASAASLIGANVRSLTPALVGVALPIIFVTYFAFRSYLDKARENAHRQELDRLYLRTVEALSVAIDARESRTLGQARHVQVYARRLALEAGIRDEKELRGIESAALLLDIGNLAVPESILNKPGELTSAEFQKVMMHPVVGANILATIDFPYPMAELVRHHHERWDGSGYPDGLKGAEIPLGARILALADCFVVLTCDRPYHMAQSREKALRDIRSRAGTHYDPELVEKFARICEALTAEVPAMEAHPSECRVKEQLSKGEAPGGDAANEASGDLAAYHDIASTQREMSVLHELSLELGSTLNLREAFSIIAAKTAKLVPFTTCVIYLYSTEKGQVVAEHLSGANAGAFQDYCMGSGENISGWVVAQKQAVINADAALDLAPILGRLEIPLEFVLVHPLTLEDRCIGTISLYASREHQFKDDHLRILGGISREAASAIQNARRYGEAQEEAVLDALTGLPNIRYLRQYFDQEMAKSKRYGYPLSILGMDLDGFKAVNDGLGHQAGDRVLVEVARVLKDTLRGSDLVVRHGGDEFVAALFQTAFEDASGLAMRLQQKIDGLSFEASPGEFVRVGISIGCASSPEHGNTLEELLQAADAEMYHDKKRRAGLTTPLSIS